MLRPLLILAFLTLAWSPAEAQSQFSAAAYVNDAIITEYDVDQRGRLLRTVGRDGGRDAALQDLIDGNVKRRAAREAGFSVPEGATSLAMQNIARQAGVQPGQLESRLRGAGVSPGALRDYLETEVLWGLLVNRRYGSRAEVTESDVNAEIGEGGLTEKTIYNLGELSMPSGNNPSGVRARARQIVAEVRGGASFQDLARTHSRSPTREQGGVVGWVPEERLPPPIAASVRELAAGGVTDPISVPGGFAILTVFDKRVEEVTADGETREQVRRRLLGERLEGFADTFLEDLRDNAYIERK